MVDDEWATVGSSNLDPLSLSLNLEANVIIRDREFNRVLAEQPRTPDAPTSCKQIEAARCRRAAPWATVRSFFVFHVLRRFPPWAGWLPRTCAAPVHGGAQDRRVRGRQGTGPRRGGDATEAENGHAA